MYTHMKKHFGDRVEVSFYMEREEYNALVAASTGPVSALMRQLVRTYMDGNAGAPVPVDMSERQPAPNGEGPSVPARRPIAAKGHKLKGKSFKLPSSSGPKPVRCRHGIDQGGRCFRCPGDVATP